MDWVAITAVSGFVLALITLGLQLLQHYKKTPRLELLVKVKRDSTVNELTCKLVNKGGDDVGVRRWTLLSLDPDEKHKASIPQGAQLMGATVPGLGVYSVPVRVRVSHPAAEDVPYRLKVWLATGKEASSREFSLRVNERSDTE